MSKGVLIYALNNEQIDYAKLALNAARQVKEHLGVPVALVTDSADWLTTQYPNYKDDVDMVIKVVREAEVQPWNSSWEYSVGNLAFYNGTIWRKVNEGPDVVEVIEAVEVVEVVEVAPEEIYTFDQEDFEPVYEGIDIDKWYPNLPYLVGQHVWYDNKLYRCAIQYIEGESFSKDKYISLIDNVLDSEVIEEIIKGDIVLFNRTLWMSIVDKRKKEAIAITNTSIEKTYKIEDNFTRVYDGIDIDKWYPNLPYLIGQHVWHNDILYRCHTEYTENEEFSKDQYDIVLENVKELTQTIKFTKGDILFHERVLWMSLINYKFEQNKTDKIRYDLWEDTKERFLVYDCAPQYRQYFDGAMTHKKLKFKNDIRVKSFELSPFDETLVIDCDYLINNDILKYCWQQPHDFLIHKQAVDLSGYRYDPRLVTLSDKSIDFYWATVFFFRKNKNTEIFFEYLNHIQENWNYYRYAYQIEQSLYRNDFAFSIAIHVMNGYQNGTWAHDLPGKLYYTIDKDILLEHADTEMKFLIEKEKYRGEYTVIKTKGINVHVMNKFSISRILNEELNV
jgi:hypothetical protein